MQKSIIITADLGHLKAYAVEQDSGPGGPRIRLLQKENTEVAEHLATIVTDQAGRYRRRPPGGGQTERSDGEPHNLGLERRRRAMKALAKDINELLAREGPESWRLAAASEINAALLNALGKSARARMQQNVRANLTGVSKAKVLAHFDFRGEPAENVDFLAQRRSGAGRVERAARERRVKHGNFAHKPTARRTSSLKKAVRRQTISAQVAKEMSRLRDKGDRRRSRAERHVASAARSRRVRNRV